MRLILVVILFSSHVYSASNFLQKKQGEHFKIENKIAKKDESCATDKEDFLKKLEEKKKEQEKMGKGLSLQGATDPGCSVK